MLSLLETYISEQAGFQHYCGGGSGDIPPSQLQKTCSEILYRLSKKNQVIFKTHSPDFCLLSAYADTAGVDDERYWPPATNMSDIDDGMGPMIC